MEGSRQRPHHPQRLVTVGLLTGKAGQSCLEDGTAALRAWSSMQCVGHVAQMCTGSLSDPVTPENLIVFKKVEI